MSYNNFGPFEAEVWGTVGEVVTAFMSIATAVFILFTLRSQLKVQRLQEKHTAIETFNHQISIMPKFDVSVETIENTFEEGIGVFEVAFSLQLNNQIAKKLEINLIHFGSAVITHQPNNIMGFCNSNDLITFQAGFRSIYRTDINAFKLLLVLELKYNDYDNNSYIQECNVIFQIKKPPKTDCGNPIRE